VEQTIQWVIENKGWLFSGIAITIPIAIISLLLRKKRASNINVISHKMANTKGISVQSGRDSKITK